MNIYIEVLPHWRKYISNSLFSCVINTSILTNSHNESESYHMTNANNDLTASVPENNIQNKLESNFSTNAFQRQKQINKLKAELEQVQAKINYEEDLLEQHEYILENYDALVSKQQQTIEEAKREIFYADFLIDRDKNLIDDARAEIDKLEQDRKFKVKPYKKRRRVTMIKFIFITFPYLAFLAIEAIIAFVVSVICMLIPFLRDDSNDRRARGMSDESINSRINKILSSDQPNIKMSDSASIKSYKRKIRNERNAELHSLQREQFYRNNRG